jgi:hypothetical protein
VVLDDRRDEAICFLEIEIQFGILGVGKVKARREDGGLGLQSHAAVFQRNFN